MLYKYVHVCIFPDVKDHVIKLETTIEGLTKILDSIKTEMQKLKEQKNQQKHATSMYIKMFPPGEHVAYLHVHPLHAIALTIKTIVFRRAPFSCVYSFTLIAIEYVVFVM